MKISGKEFENSSTCQGESFVVAGAPLDIAEITIDGRYPESGWVRNRESHEMVRVLRGAGKLALRDGLTTCIEEGNVVYVPAKEWFAWNGDMTILMACSPAFNPNQYEVDEAL